MEYSFEKFDTWLVNEDVAKPALTNILHITYTLKINKIK